MHILYYLIKNNKKRAFDSFFYFKKTSFFSLLGTIDKSEELTPLVIIRPCIYTIAPIYTQINTDKTNDI